MPLAIEYGSWRSKETINWQTINELNARCQLLIATPTLFDKIDHIRVRSLLSI